MAETLTTSPAGSDASRQDPANPRPILTDDLKAPRSSLSAYPTSNCDSTTLELTPRRTQDILLLIVFPLKFFVT